MARRHVETKQITSLSDLLPDSRNANEGTERGIGMLEHSIRTYGAGRSVLADRAGRIIAGNKTVERAVELGLGIEVVRTRGDKLVVVQREDLDLEDPENADARALAVADNRVAEVDLSWSADALRALQVADTDLTAFFLDDELADLLAPPSRRNQHVEFTASTQACTCCQRKCRKGCGCYGGD